MTRADYETEVSECFIAAAQTRAVARAFSAEFVDGVPAHNIQAVALNPEEFNYLFSACFDMLCDLTARLERLQNHSID